MQIYKEIIAIYAFIEEMQNPPLNPNNSCIPMRANFIESWIGRSQTEQDTVAASLARRLAVLLDQPAPAWRPGDEIPRHWYQILFVPLAAQASLAQDGHPAKGDFLPPVPLPRRMFAGRKVQFHAPLRVGAALTRASTIHSIANKTGRSGEMCFVTVRHRITDEANLLLVEEDQDIVYRSEASTGKSSPIAEGVAKADELPAHTRESQWTPGETELFRYSAITFNAHRIHYDLPFTREIEGYKGLVVNGGLTTMKLWDWATRQLGRPLIASRSRNMRPLFVGEAVQFRLTEISSQQALAWVVDSEGRTSMKMELELGGAA